MPLSPYLIARLTELVGPENATVDPLDLAAYSYDAALDRAMPEMVVFPLSTRAVSEVLRLCHGRGIPVTPRGSGTCLSGGPLPLRGGVVLELARMNALLEIDLPNQRAVVQPGYLNFDFVETLATHGHLYAPDPASQRVCTMGGNVAENSGGPHCLKYGVTTNHVTGLEVVLPDGEAVRLGGKTLESPGYDLRGVVIGSEGTLGVVTEITCRILPLPESIVTMLAIFDSLIKAGEAVSAIIASGMIPATLEMMDRPIIRAVEEAVHAGYPLDAEAVLIIELDGMAAGMDEQVRQVTEVCRHCGAIRFEVARDAAHRDLLWRGRKGAFGAVARIAPSKMTTDIAVPRNAIAHVLASVLEIAQRHNVRVGTLFHAGDGNLHPQLLFDDRDADEVSRVKAADKEIAQLAIEVGGVLTGEHGIGSQKAYAMALANAPQDLAAMRAIKRIFDPQGTLNPDKILPEADERELALSPAPASAPLPPAGADMMAVGSYEEAAALLAEATRERRAVAPMGGGTKIGDSEGRLGLCTRPLREIVDYDWENLTVTAQAGMTVTELQAALARHGQFAPLTAPLADRATLGGVIAANSNGPWRYGYGELRDVLLGVRFTTCAGQVVNSGSKTVKNVSGYDIKRLLVGSCGSLGLIVEATFRTLPVPPAEETLLVRVARLEDAVATASAVRLSHLLPSAIEALSCEHWNVVAPQTGLASEDCDAWHVLFSLRGHEADVTEMRSAIPRLAEQHGGTIAACLDREASTRLWRAVPEPFALLEPDFAALKVTVPPGEVLAPAHEALFGCGSSTPLVRISLGSGMIHVTLPDLAGDADSWRQYAESVARTASSAGGWLSVDRPAGRAAEMVAHRVGAGGPACDRISAAIKRAFDPAGVLPAIPS